MASLSYRFVIISLLCGGMIISYCIRSTFVMTVTHTTRLNSHEGASEIADIDPFANSQWSEEVADWPEEKAGEGEGGANIYKDCTVYNTSRDYVSDFGWRVSVTFYSVHLFGMGTGYVLALYLVSVFRFRKIILTGWAIHAILTVCLPTVFQVSGLAVSAIRFVVGFSESVLQSAVVGISSSWAFQKEQSSFLAVAFIGNFLSPALVSVITGACLCYVSWDAALYIFSILFIIWSVLWAVLSYDSPLDCPRVSESDKQRYEKEQKHSAGGSKAKVPWKKLLTSMPVWAIWVATVNKNCNEVAVTTLMPLFFKDVYNIQAADSGILLIGPFLCNTACVVLSSWLSDRIIHSGMLSTTNTRKLMQCLGAAGESILLVCTVYAPDWTYSVACLTLAYGMGGLCFPGFSCNMMDISPRFTGTVSAFSCTGFYVVVLCMVGASMVPRQVGGVDKWTILFWTNAGIAAFSSIFYLVFASGELQKWNDVEQYQYEKALESESDEENTDFFEEDTKHISDVKEHDKLLPAGGLERYGR